MFLPNDEFLDLVRAMPLAAVDLILTRPDGAVLLGRRLNQPAQGFWFTPGGRIRKDECLADALARVVLAEMGPAVPVLGWQRVNFWEHLYEDNFAGEPGVSTHYLALAHRLQLEAEVELSFDSQHEEMAWWPVVDLLASEAVHENTKAYFR
ncbi:GDP-mannose mannosyl hydrolase [Uliginosibacterium flavum]|uniref:GDP-mannose mannosyl hydrolase n=1 Tax=Uliginosibacterium flavum TaxID=1396831 RepID=A0ABV2TT58_9RHOO